MPHEAHVAVAETDVPGRLAGRGDDATDHQGDAGDEDSRTAVHQHHQRHGTGLTVPWAQTLPMQMLPVGLPAKAGEAAKAAPPTTMARATTPLWIRLFIMSYFPSWTARWPPCRTSYYQCLRAHGLSMTPTSCKVSTRLRLQAMAAESG